MLFNSFSHQPASLLSIPSSKIGYSQGTDTSDPLPLSKQISLSSCASSMSISSQMEPSKENQLFGQYLFALNTSNETSTFQVLNSHYQLISNTDPQKILKLLWPIDEAKDMEDKVLQHFIMKWLYYMGYGSNSNKKYFISRVKLYGGHQFTHQMTKVYTNLALLGVNRQQLRCFLLGTCKNGWEYFVKGILARLDQSSRLTRKV